MRTFLTTATLLCLASTHATARPREVQRLQPTSQWHVDYADESCQLARTFGEGAGALRDSMDGGWGELLEGFRKALDS